MIVRNAAINISKIDRNLADEIVTALLKLRKWSYFQMVKGNAIVIITELVSFIVIRTDNVLGIFEKTAVSIVNFFSTNYEKVREASLLQNEATFL